MVLALKTIIVRERERKRQEEEMADKIVERRKQQLEKLRKKREAETLTLEQTKEQIIHLEDKLVSLRGEKHDLFLQLKKVLNESENRRKQIKEHEMRASMTDYTMTHPTHHQYPPIPLHGSHMLPVQGHQESQESFSSNRRALSAALSSLLTSCVCGRFLQTESWTPPYTSSQASSSAFISQAQAGYPHRQQASLHSSFTTSASTNPSKYQARDSPFSAYPLHYSHEGQGDHFPPGFQGFPPGAQHVQASLEQPSKSSTFAEEQSHYQSKLQSQHLRPIGSVQALQQHQALLPPQVSHIQQAQGKGLPASYQSRRKPDSPVYGQKKPGQSPHGAAYQGGQPPRPSGYSTATSHGGHAGGRFY
ncbi:putative G protein pathway suppressor 2 [Apostichopus japonicus]|uniref:Putative G protein pathway suppressor 2 n=1 Tax=Stichopus japonicus TaxID=307972 RepID=A0A2G8KNL4_STIJA|nr:putative G protein pathway suppressor 2 [Apostichopus japonicus]